MTAGLAAVTSSVHGHRKISVAFTIMYILPRESMDEHISKRAREREDSDFPSPRMQHSGKLVFEKCTSRLYFRLACFASIRKERFIARQAQAIVLGPGALSAATNAKAPCFKKDFSLNLYLPRLRELYTNSLDNLFSNRT